MLEGLCWLLAGEGPSSALFPACGAWAGSWLDFSWRRSCVTGRRAWALQDRDSAQNWCSLRHLYWEWIRYCQDCDLVAKYNRLELHFFFFLDNILRNELMFTKDIFFQNHKMYFWHLAKDCVLLTSCCEANFHLAGFPIRPTQFWRGGVGDSASFTNVPPLVSDRARDGSWQFAWGSRALN